MLHRGEELRADMLPPEITGEASALGPGAPGLPVPDLSPRDAARRRDLVEALERTGWVPEEAAKVLGISRATIYRRMKKLGLSARDG